MSQTVYDPLLTLRPERPRLFFTPEATENLRATRHADPVAREALEQMLSGGRAALGAPPLDPEMKGFRLSAPKEALRRLFLWSLAHSLCPDPVWADRVRAEVDAILSFPDWNPSHFLCTAEMSAALAVALDTFYPVLSEAERDRWADGLARLALLPGGKEQDPWWSLVPHNWNPVCHGGLCLAALAVAERHPEIARSTLVRARARLPLALAAYGPDGVHHESPTYWDFGTGYFVFLAMGLLNALGDDWGISDHPGFRKSFDYRLHVIGPTGFNFKYGDGNDDKPELILHPWMSFRTGCPVWAGAARDSLRQRVPASWSGRLAPLGLLAWSQEPLKSPTLPLDWRGGGGVEIFSARSSWSDPGATWFAVRAGTIQVNHAHMDLGSFVMEAEGVRWAVELGKESGIYARQDTWGLNDESARWRFLRANSLSHNTLSLDGALQKTEGHAPLLAHHSAPEAASVEIDLTAPYAGHARAVRRRLALENGRKSFRLTDTLEGLAAKQGLRWQWVTRAQIEVDADGRSATLRQAGKGLHVRLLSPSPGARFGVETLDTSWPDETPNDGFRMLALRWDAPLPDPAVIDVEAKPTGP